MKHQMPMGEQIKLPPTLALMLGIDRAPRVAIDAMLDQAIAELDRIDGDPDFEPNGDDEPVRAEGDSSDAAWVEWDQMRGSQKRGPNVIQGLEDDEDADPAEEDDPAGQCDEDGMNTYPTGVLNGNGPGCPIADPDCGADDNCCDDDEMDLDEGYFDHPGFILGGGSGMEGES